MYIFQVFCITSRLILQQFFLIVFVTSNTGLCHPVPHYVLSIICLRQIRRFFCPKLCEHYSNATFFYDANVEQIRKLSLLLNKTNQFRIYVNKNITYPTLTLFSKLYAVNHKMHLLFKNNVFIIITVVFIRKIHFKY